MQGALKAWHVTEAGADVVERIDPLGQPVKILSRQNASGALQAHTLGVNDVGICFLTAARKRGDDFGSLSWRHEIAHPLGPARGRRRQLLIADALLTYLVTGHHGRSSLQYRFIELDRATLTVERLARKLSRYATLYRHRHRGSDHPAWRDRYPAFPAVLCVLASQRRHILERRRGAVAALCRTDLELISRPQVAITIGLLEDIQARGVFAHVLVDVRRPEERINWLGHTDER